MPSSFGPFAAQDQQGNSILLILLGRLEDTHHLAVGKVTGPPSLGSGSESITQAVVGERAAYHDLMISPPRAVGVELGDRYAVSDQVAARRTIRLDRTRR